LTDVASQDLSQGYGLHCFDMQKGAYDLALAEELGIQSALLPEIVDCHQVIGKVTKAAAQACGLPEGTPVVAGGLDAACGALGAGVLRSGQTQLQGGQAGGMGICLDQYRPSPALIMSYHVVPGHWLLQGGTVGGGGALRWFRAQFGQDESFDELTAQAEAIKPGADGLIFLPYMAGERSPIWDKDAKGILYGLDYSKTKAHAIRAVLEGVAFSIRHNLEAAAEAGAFAVEFCATGGAGNSPLWMQIKSDVTGVPIAVPASDTATTLGAAILAGVGTGLYSSFAEAVETTVTVNRTYKPNAGNKNVYDENYAMYRRIYERLTPYCNQ
ncbi:MAG: FGGY-family carbohydrate kinase, partial [Defluviitaleaceae bacterium]|nr:FGGY-family carbohydrate kinase [Defluviitaleaceae bacterium]